MKMKIASVLLIFVITIGLFPLVPVSIALAEEYASLMLWYKFDEASGTTVIDYSGKNHNGTLNGGYARTTALDGLGAVEFDGSSGYVAIPNGILSGITDITISTKVYVDNSNVDPAWIWTFGSSSNAGATAGTKYLGLLEDGSKKLRASITTDRWSAEQTVSKGAALTRGVWKHIVYTLSGTTATLYEDGVKISENTNVTDDPSVIEATIANYIGKPAYSGDKYFKGKISDFRMYTRALDGSEIKTISDGMSSDIVTKDTVVLDLGDLTQITKDITLPTIGVNGSEISWSSSDEDVISSAGSVNRPSESDGNKTVTLTATISKGGISDMKVFTTTVIALQAGEEDPTISEARNLLTIQNADDVRGNITLPKTLNVGTKTVNIIWTTDRSDIVGVNEKMNEGYDSTPVGVVKRPNEDTAVTLTANITYGTASGTKDIIITVKAKPAPINESDYKGYLFTYFTNANRPDAEQTYFSLSKDGLHWDELNDNNPTLTSTVGTKGVRDQFIMRSPEGDKFYLIATDLRIADTDWGTCQRAGSKSVVIWESTDLVNWSKERLVKVATDDAGCTWAPEIVYDDKTGEYVMFWASRVASDNYAKQRIYIAKTRDFYTFTEPQVWLERSLDVIDTDVIKYNGIFYRFSKDEVNKNIVIDKSDEFLSKSYTSISSPSVEAEKGVEGPAVFKFNNENKWCLLVDNFGSTGYYPLVSDDIASGVFRKLSTSEYKLPSGPRHGTVIPITQAEYDAVQAKWGENVVRPVEEPQTNPILEYKFDETKTGSTIEDTSGNDRAGTLNGNATYVQDSEKGQVLYLDGTTNTFASLPQGFFEGRDTVTVSMDIKPVTVSGNFFTFGIGKDSNKYMFLKTMDTTIRNAITTGSWSTEQEVKGTTTSIANKWMNIKLVITPTSMAVYKDGILLSKNSNVAVSMSDLGTDLLAYLGKSFYSGDAYFKGYFDNIKVYNHALSEFEIAKEFGANVSALKGVSADGYTVIKNEYDVVNKKLKVYFSRSNSSEASLTAIPLNYILSDGCAINILNGQVVDLTDSIPVTITLPDGSTQEWTVEGVIANNPVLGGQFADPDIDVFGDKFYIYPTTDGYSGWSGTQFHAFSSSDMINWNDEGVIVDAGANKDVPWGVGSAWAPTIEEKNGKYYFYFCAKRSGGESCIGVAVADSPTGPFKVKDTPLITPEIASAEGVSVGQTIDPSIFTDDDEKSYMTFGNGSPAIVELNDDMISFKSGTMKNLIGAKDFRESMIVTKRDGTYHFTWSCDDTGSENYHVNYGISDNLYGPITYKYPLLSKDTSKDILGTGHHSILKIPNKDEYYIAYHRFVTPLGQYSSGLGYHRETCIDKLEFDDDTGLMKVITPTLEGITEPVTLTTNYPESLNKVEMVKNDNTLTAELLYKDGSKFTTDAAVEYKWYRDNELVEGENSNTYNISNGDKGKKIKVSVPQYSLTSESIYIVDDSRNSDKPAKVEISRNDDILTAELLNEDGSEFTTDAAVKYEWYRDGEPVEDENSNTYNLSNDDQGKKIKVGVLQYNLVSDYIYISADPVEPTNPTEESKLARVSIKGTERVGKTLEAQLLTESGTKFTTSSAVTYEWYRLSSKDSDDGKLVGDDETYKLVSSDKGKYIRLEVNCNEKTFEDITSRIAKKSSSSSGSSNSSSNDNETSSSSSSNSNLSSSVNDITDNSSSINNESTTIFSGWKNEKDNTWMYIENGQPVNGWKEIDGYWYFMSPTGIMLTDWQQWNNNWYFLKESGAMATGWIESNGQWYYLYSNGAMASNTVINGYKLDENGAWIK